MNKGKYIVVEGVDGTGKTSAVNILKQTLEARGRKVELVSILRSDPVAAMIRAILTDPNNEIHPDAEACLYAAAVTNTYRHKVLPLLASGVDVICDRSHLSALMYQAATARAQGNQRPTDILKAAYDGGDSVDPDAIIMLFVTPALGLARVRNRDGKMDRIEMRGEDFQEEVQQAYRKYCEDVSTGQSIFQYRNDGSLQELTDFIQSAVSHMYRYS